VSEGEHAGNQLDRGAEAQGELRLIRQKTSAASQAGVAQPDLATAIHRQGLTPGGAVRVIWEKW